MRLARHQIVIAFDPVHGRIIELSDQRRNITLVQEPALTENFRLLVPLADWRGHYITGAEQTLSAHRSGEDWIELQWDGLTSRRGTFDISYILRVEIGPDVVRFNSKIINRSPHVVEEVFTPALGGLANRAEAAEWRLFYSNWGGNGDEWSFYDRCQNAYLGPDNPTHVMSYPGSCSMPWIDLSNPARRVGVYMCPEDPEPRVGAWFFQLKPGANWAGTHWGWPDPEVEKVPVGLTLAWVNYAFVKPGQTWSSAPVAFRFHDGTWYEAAALYRQWWDQHFNVADESNWLGTADAWQSTIISYPEDTIGYRYADLPRLAKAAKSAGIEVLQIDGWDQGGIDRDYPHYVTDPRLGTEQELIAALAECERLGVRVMLFSNLLQVHLETEWYQRELHRYVIRDPRGHPIDTMGWEYNTVNGLAGNSKTRMMHANPAHQAFGNIMQEAYERIARYGAAGTQVDKVGNGYGGNMDGHPDLAMLAPDLSVTRPIIAAFERHLTACRGIRPDYGIAVESHWDRLFSYSQATYARHWHDGSAQAMAVTFPEHRQTCCVTGNSDFALVSSCLRMGHIINLEAKCLHGSAEDVPAMRDFIRAAVALRKSLRDVIWMSRLVDPAPHFSVQGDVHLRHALHESRTVPGRRALVLNHYAKQALPATIEPHAGTCSAMIYTIGGDPQRVRLPGTISVPPGNVAIIVPEVC